MKLSDRQLLILAAEGHRQAFEQLYARYAARLKSYFYLHNGEDDALAEDQRQELFLNLLKSKAWQQPQQGPDSLGPLLFTMAANLLKNHYRHQNRLQRKLNNLSQKPDTHASRPSSQAEDPRLEHALNQLGSDHRRCIVLKYRHGLAISEIAELLDCPTGTVKSRIHYALRQLSEQLPRSLLLDQINR